MKSSFKKPLKIIEPRISRTPGYLELFSRSLRVRDNEISLYILIVHPTSFAVSDSYKFKIVFCYA
jgi:hypothetical protein